MPDGCEPSHEQPTLGGVVALSRAQRLYDALFDTNEAILRASGRADLFRRLCDVMLRGRLIVLSSVLVPNHVTRMLESVAASGIVPVDRVICLPFDPTNIEDHGPGNAAFASGKVAVNNRWRSDPRSLPWERANAKLGIEALAAIPVVENDRTVAVFWLCANEPDAFDEATVRLLERVGENIRQALANFDRDERNAETQRQLARFRRALEITREGLLLVDRRTMRFVDCNAMACVLAARSREQLLQCGPHDLVEVPLSTMEAEYDALIARSPQSVVAEEYAHDGNGVRRTYEVMRCAIQSGDDWIIVNSVRDITGRKLHDRLLRLEHLVTRCFVEGGDDADLLARVLRAVCESEGWEAGEFFRVSQGGGEPHRAAAWQHHERPTGAAPEPAGVRRMLSSAEATWVAADVSSGAPARFGFPVLADGKVVGAMMFVARRILRPDRRLLQAVHVIGGQVGQYLQRRDAEKVGTQNAARFRSLTELSSDWYWEQDAQLRFTTIGGGFADGGVTRQVFAVAGSSLDDLPDLIADSADFATQREVMQRRERFLDFQFALRRSDGSERWLSLSGEPINDEQGRFLGYRGVARDVSDRRQAEQRIHHLATHDTLTGLPNRVMFSEMLNQSIDHARRSDDRFAVMFIDLDRFKVINETLGHDVGDELLKQVGRRFRECVRSTDVFARLGGDEFVVLLRQVSHEAEIAAVARKILDAATLPIVVGTQECRITASIGVCRYPADAQDEQSLMKGADMAMYLAKQEGKNNFQFFSAHARSESLVRGRLETQLRLAMERREFSLHYQPKIDLASGRICGFEALLRWQSAELGHVSPVDFIPLAEETGLILPIGKWVLATACAQNVAWQTEGLPPVVMAVNLSVRQFGDENLLEDIAAVLRHTGMAPELLEIEITESMVAQGADRAVGLLNDLKAMGVRLAIDDFGTGYSSLAQLKRFPIDSLKVDRSFIRDIPSDREDMAITHAIIAMSKTLGLTVVAEGVETADQREFLAEHRCDQMQGFLFSRPVPPQAVVQLWRQHLERKDMAVVHII